MSLVLQVKYLTRYFKTLKQKNRILSKEPLDVRDIKLVFSGKDKLLTAKNVYVSGVSQ